MFSDVDECYNGQNIRVELVNASNFDYKFESIYKDLGEGKAVFVITTYQTIGSGKNIQYKIPDSEKDSIIYCKNDVYKTKDFDAIYLLTPTNLLQTLNYESENRYADLSRYLFHQEYLYQNRYLTYYEMKHNIANGFRKTFFQDQFPFYVKNGDLYLNTLRLIIQAVGRICRCRNKNKKIYLYSDREVVERIQYACNKQKPKLLNKEFEELLLAKLKSNKITKIEDYSKQSKRAFYAIQKLSQLVRESKENVEAWKALREYVLQNPTADSVPYLYIAYYFEFPDKYSGYSYRYGKNFDIIDIKTDVRYHDMEQISEQTCDLPIILSTKNYIFDLFKINNYATTFKKGKYLMTPSLFKQVYLGALGEVVGRIILEKELGYELQELDDVSFYEFFDYKIGNVYFDFKHWNNFRIDVNTYSIKIKRKLSRIKGAKCFIINLIKRTDAPFMKSIDDTIIQIPYLIDGEKGIINEKGIDYIQEMIIKSNYKI